MKLRQARSTKQRQDGWIVMVIPGTHINFINHSLMRAEILLILAGQRLREQWRILSYPASLI